MKATALTIVTCIGFSVTIVSIQMLTLWISAKSVEWLFFLLLPGPLFGLLSLARLKKV
jgi:hypothetical protein